MDLETSVPPGFRFHPTEEELVGYYLKRKINSQKIDLDVIFEIDLYKIEPWDIQDRCKLGYDEQNEWYFFSHKDKKYPTGTRTNRATTAGFWKATGRDKAVISKDRVIGMRKTLVFYKGRAPNGGKTDWIMHEYRLQISEHLPPQEEGWVVCRAFRKPTPSQRPDLEAWNQAFLRYQNYRPPSFSPSENVAVNAATLSTHLIDPSHHGACFSQQFMSEDQIQLVQGHVGLDSQRIELPSLDSPNTPTISTGLTTEDNYNDGKGSIINSGYQCLEWKSLDNLLDSQMADLTYYQPSTSLASMIPHNHDMQAQSHISSIFGCYPDSYNLSFRKYETE